MALPQDPVALAEVDTQCPPLTKRQARHLCQQGRVDSWLVCGRVFLERHQLLEVIEAGFRPARSSTTMDMKKGPPI